MANKIKKSFFICILSFLCTLHSQAFNFLLDDISETLPDINDQREITLIDFEHAYDLNPHTASYTSEAQILTGLYEGLFSYDPVNLEPVNALCETYKISRDKKRWTFIIKKGITFSNGNPITANTIKDSWISLLQVKDAPFASLLDSITGATDFRNGKCKSEDVGIIVRDDYTLVVHLNEPESHLSRILCHHAFAAVSTLPNVYSGAFVVSSYNDNTLILKKNEKYREASSVLIPGIIIKQSNNYDENSFIFNNGEADWICGGAIADKILNKDSTHINAMFGTQYIFFKGKNEPWDKVEFRNALLQAIPYEELRKPYAVKADTFVYPLTGYPSINGINEYDIDEAMDMMKEARKKYGIPEDKKLPIVFAITDNMKDWANLLKKAWEPLGVELNIQTTPDERYNTAIPSWTADLFVYSWIGDFADPIAFLELYRGNSTLNVAGYKNETYDNLLIQAAREEDYKEHYSLLAKAEQTLLDDGMIIPISHPVSFNVLNTNIIGGWKNNALDLHPLRYLYIKKQKIIELPNVVMAY